MAIRAFKLHITEVVLNMICYDMLEMVQLFANTALPECPAILRNNFFNVLGN